MLHAFHFYPTRAACHVHLILVDFIIQIIFDEVHKLPSSSLCSSLQPPVTSSFLGPNFSLSTLFSNTLSLCSFLNIKD
jgi:hypothetical protein